MTKQPWNKNKSIGQKIKERREQLGLTQPELARRIKVQKQRIADLEDTSKRPSAEKLFEISQALEVPMLYFLTDCELNSLDEEVLLASYRKLNKKDKKLTIDVVKLLIKDNS